MLFNTINGLVQLYLVFGVLDDEAITAGLCGGTEQLAQIPADDLASLGNGTSPSAQGPAGENTADPAGVLASPGSGTSPAAQSSAGENAADPAGGSSGSSSGLLLVVGALAAALVLGLGVVVLRRRSHPDA